MPDSNIPFLLGGDALGTGSTVVTSVPPVKIIDENVPTVEIIEG